MPGAPRVLMFGWEFPPYNTGGLGVACYGLTQGLSNLGVPIAFALPRQLSQNVSFMKILSHKLQGVEITAINALMQAYMHPQDYASLWPYYISSGFYGSNIYDEAMRFADLASVWSMKQPHQIIHMHDWMTFPAGVKAKTKSGQPLVAHIHATEYDRTGGAVDSRIADLEYQGLSAADKIIAVSQYTKNIVHKFYRIPQEKITVVHNGINPVDFTPQSIRQIFPHDKVVLYVGRLTFQKGVDHFLKTAKEVLLTHPHTIFLVVGTGDMYQQLIMDAAYLGISDRVIFSGFLTGQKLKSVYQMADVFIMPSISEPYGLVALEAAASGVPVIISKQSGVSESLPHAYQVDFWDIQKMAKLVRYIFDFPSFAKERHQAVKVDMKQCTWDKAARRTLNLYHTLL